MSGRKKTVLIIDDSSYMRTFIGNILKRNGYRVIGEAENGKTGVEKYKALRPDIVTTDIIMDEKSGFDTIDDILSHDANAKIVVISSMASPFTEEVTAKGAKAVVRKPVDEYPLIQAMQGLG